MGVSQRNALDAVADSGATGVAPTVQMASDQLAQSMQRRRFDRNGGTLNDSELPPVGAPLIETYAALAAQAEAGVVDAALRLAQDLERCLRRRETASVLAIMARYPDATPKCESVESCRAIDAIYDEFDSDLEQLKATETLCRDVPREWMDLRGRWLQRAAEIGDTEARACYALVGIEVAPYPAHASWGPWMNHWRQYALTWAWDAWRRGDPRAALALARIYAPDGYWKGDASDLADADVRMQYRFALLLTLALNLDPERDDLAGIAAADADSLSENILSQEIGWVEGHLPRMLGRIPVASQTPDDCWGHFAIFTR